MAVRAFPRVSEMGVVGEVTTVVGRIRTRNKNGTFTNKLNFWKNFKIFEEIYKATTRQIFYLGCNFVCK